MASTSLVCVLSAITDGSLSTMPSPLAYTSVFAVPRSMARSRATGGAAPGYSGSTAGDSPWPVGAPVSLGAPRSRREDRREGPGLAGSVERLAAVRRGGGHHHRGLTDRHEPHAMQQHEATERGEAGAGHTGELLEAGHDLALVGLVLQSPHPGSPRGVVARRAGERN